jgi:hypothetical protein
MKTYGTLSEVRKHEGFTEMSSIAIALTPEAMEKFAGFVAYAASEMKRLGNAYDQTHFMDFCKDWHAAWPDVQLTRVYEHAQASGR